MERAYIRPISVEPDNKSGGCTLCGELHQISEGLACDIKNRPVANVGLPISHSKLLEANEVAYTMQTPTVISENGVTVAILSEGGDTESLLQTAPLIDIFIETIDPDVLNHTPSDSRLRPDLDGIRVAQFKLEAGIPINVKPYHPQTRANVVNSSRHNLL